VPFIVFLVGGVLEPTPGGGGLAGAVGIPYAAYPLIYAARLVATGAALVWAWRPIREWVGRTTWWPVPLGLLLVIPWIVLAALQRESGFVSQATERSGFDPFTQFASPGAAWAFLAVRFLGLVVIVPIVEELFLRGFLMRYVIDENFRAVPFGRLTLASTTACLVYAVATHPAEAVAALAWFAVMSGVATATRRPIDVILAHAATNLALGAYVVATASWWLM
jgi:CAAX prenyl protease-like protein